MVIGGWLVNRDAASGALTERQVKYFRAI